ncbi:MAG: M4 family metallopeptidase [Actinomycetota bacterium]
MTGCRSPFQCIVPPVLLERIARNGTDKQRGWALDTMATDTTLRAARIQNAGARSMMARRALAELDHGTGKPRRTIRDAKSKEDLTGVTVRDEGQGPCGDKAADEAYDGFGHTFNFFWDIFKRDSINDQGMELLGIVHFGKKYDNAFWDGQRMVFGDGDGEIFNRLTASLDVIAHELAHGVTEHESGLVYMGQPGALNESLSDVWGSCVKQYMLKQKAEDADWLIGAGLLTKKVKGVALRSMKAPGTAYDDKVLGRDPQPGHMKNYNPTQADNGGVHINSGIPNHAFYTTAVTLGGYSWERAGKIWYEASKSPRLRPNSRFEVFAKSTLATAVRLYGADSDETRAVKAGWDKVGITAA